jgi:hypothetical protein
MRRILLPMLFACLGAPLAAQDAPSRVVVRESLDPPTGAVIGQHVALRVDVLFSGDMPHPPRVSLPNVAGVQAMRFETQATTLRGTIAGDTYIGQRFEFALCLRTWRPRRAATGNAALVGSRSAGAQGGSRTWRHHRHRLAANKPGRRRHRLSRFPAVVRRGTRSPHYFRDCWWSSAPTPTGYGSICRAKGIRRSTARLLRRGCRCDISHLHVLAALS